MTIIGSAANRRRDHSLIAKTNNAIPGTQSRTEGGGVGGLTYSTHLAKEAQGAVTVLMLCVAGGDARQTTVGGDENVMVVAILAFKQPSTVRDA